MRNFIVGVIFTVLIIAVGGLVYLLLVFAPTNADANPSRMESWVASGAMDTSMEKHAPHLNNPVPATDSNLIDGMKIYTMNCATCNAAPDKKPRPLQYPLYAPATQICQ